MNRNSAHKLLLLIFVLSTTLFALPEFETAHSYSRREARNLLSKSRSSTYQFVSNRSEPKTVKLFVFRVEFYPDSSTNTTGNGLFGIRKDIVSEGSSRKAIPWSLTDKQEREWYEKYGTDVYQYDRIPHKKVYLENHLNYLKNYFTKISDSMFTIETEIFPAGPEEGDAYSVPREMFRYSPGAKKSNESNDDYYLRRTRELMAFIRDALVEVDTTSVDGNSSPISRLEMKPDGSLWDGETQVFLMIFHAGSSVLTDGGYGGGGNANSQSDMSDAFIDERIFEYFNENDNVFEESVQESPDGVTGVVATGLDSSQIFLSEVMMVPEMSNQDSLNYGINGILVNQFARQLGIPDLYSTTAGISGIGAFGVMDFAGYSAGQGFIPPYPSAWVRVAMGWDTPIVLDSIYFDTPLNAVGTATDSTTILVPINSHEYWLIENRQRNLTGNPNIFLYDTTDGTKHISSGFQVNLQEAIDSTAGSVVIRAKSQDIGIPGSGALVWHIDEDIIKNRIQHNMINADSTYRGISLEEADGVVDIGIEFTDILNGAQYDYGGAQDVFPHLSSYNDNVTKSMGSKTSPSTISNDGGNSFRSIEINSSSTKIEENYLYNRGEGKYEEYFVTNYSDSTLLISTEFEKETVVEGNLWNRRVGQTGFFDMCSVDFNGDGVFEVALLDSLGRLSIYDATGKLIQDVVNPRSTVIYDTLLTITNDTIIDTTTLSFTDSIPGAFTLPSSFGSNLYLPNDSGVTVIEDFSITGVLKKEVNLNGKPSTWVSAFDDNSWVIGTSVGEICFVVDDSLDRKIKLSQTSSEISTVSIFNIENGLVAAVSIDGNLVVSSKDGAVDSIKIETNKNDRIYPPFKMVTGDLDADGVVEIVVTDLKQGLWIFEADSDGSNIQYHSEFQVFPNDWAGIFKTVDSRSKIPDNGSSPALTDIDGDGTVDIIVAGSNGVYAFNHRGVLLEGWPALLDRVNWSARKSVFSSPITVFDSKGEPFTIFSSPTGDKITYHVYKVTHTEPDPFNSGNFIAYYNDANGLKDSVDDLSFGFIDTLLNENDSLILPYVAPGGGVDGRNSSGKRPTEIVDVPQTIQKMTYSNWPLSTSGRITSSPLVTDLDGNGYLNVLAVNDAGILYQWEIDTAIISNFSESNLVNWPVTGGSSMRQFALSGNESGATGSQTVEYFYSYPNPVKIYNGEQEGTTFRYRLGEDATSATLDIYTMSGYHLLHRDDLSAGSGINEYKLHDLRDFGSAVYRCRLSVDFNGAEKVEFWKMVVLKGSKND
jgi:hypothetical protein